LGELNGLEVLRVRGIGFRHWQACPLQELPASLVVMTGLETLDLMYCKSLTMLPESLGQLTALRTLDLSYCDVLLALPASLGALMALETMYLRDCRKLATLPAELRSLMSLRIMDLRECSGLTALPAGLGVITSLQRIDLSGCNGHSMLGVVSAGGAGILQYLHSLTCIQHDCGEGITMTVDFCSEEDRRHFQTDFLVEEISPDDSIYKKAHKFADPCGPILRISTGETKLRSAVLIKYQIPLHEENNHVCHRSLLVYKLPTGQDTWQVPHDDSFQREFRDGNLFLQVKTLSFSCWMLGCCRVRIAYHCIKTHSE